MEPINKAERKKAFLNFMLLFLVCTAIVVTTVFFSTRVPLKQNDVLLEYKKSVEENNKLKIDFTEKMIPVSQMIDQLNNKNPAELANMSATIDSKIIELDKMFPAENEENKLYMNVIKNLRFYKLAKIDMKAGNDNNASVKELNATIERLNQQIFDLKSDILTCKGQLLNKKG